MLSLTLAVGCKVGWKHWRIHGFVWTDVSIPWPHPSFHNLHGNPQVYKEYILSFYWRSSLYFNLGYLREWTTHRPSYGWLGEIRARLPVGTPMALFSATLPPHMLAQCTKSLYMKDDSTISIMLSTNWPNLIHAVIPMIGHLHNFNNLNFLMPKPYHPPMVLHKTLVFIDSKIYSGQLANHLLSRFPKEQQTSRPVRHLHAEMSKAHINDAYLLFKDLNGMCRILVTTASAANVHYHHLCLLLSHSKCV